MYIKDSVERVQKRATKYILNVYLMLQIKTIETKIVTTNALARIVGHYVSCKMSEIAPKYHCSTSIIHIK